MDTITIAQSFLRNGLWQAADWRAQIVNDETGEILLTAVTGDDQSMIGVRLTTETVRQLRELITFAEANMRRDDEQDECYDCRMTKQRIDELQELALSVGAVANTTLANLRIAMKRIDELSQQIGLLQAEHVSPADEQWGRDRLAETQKIVDSLLEHQVLDARRVDALERAVAQERTLRRETDDRLTATQKHLMETERDGAQAELALRKRVEYLERHAQGITGPDAGL